MKFNKKIMTIEVLQTNGIINILATVFIFMMHANVKKIVIKTSYKNKYLKAIQVIYIDVNNYKKYKTSFKESVSN